MTKEQIIEAVKNMTVLELNELVKAIEEEFGVTAAAPVVVAGGAAAGAEAAAEKRNSTSFLPTPARKNQSHQSRSRNHWPRPERSERLGRQHPEADQRRHCERRSRRNQSKTRRSWRESRNQVMAAP